MYWDGCTKYHQTRMLYNDCVQLESGIRTAGRILANKRKEYTTDAISNNQPIGFCPTG